ncbi:hypothetical protein [Acidisphaera sp. L21]|jgi:hypothetical protein|uniref:hypothetical protein n=1 Tax=Acidisphaera sp. L21 TaxID=1641851 RepID=UPI00131C64CB|nr:hypothetical protein [Acidisphaera sp. L21]
MGLERDQFSLLDAVAAAASPEGAPSAEPESSVEPADHELEAAQRGGGQPGIPELIAAVERLAEATVAAALIRPGDSSQDMSDILTRVRGVLGRPE